jgi:hypothetical protein
MRNRAHVVMWWSLLVAASCGESSSESGGEIDSQEDVQGLFEDIVPDLVAAFGDLANQQSLAALSSSASKGGGNSIVQCPGGGTLSVNRDTGEATLTNCSVGGEIISGTLVLVVTSDSPPMYRAEFSGTFMVSGTYTGEVEVVSATIEWTEPATETNTSWDVTVLLNGEEVTVSSDDGNGGGDVAASELQLYNNSPFGTVDGTYTVTAPGGTRTGTLTASLMIIEIDLRVGDEVTIQVNEDNIACTVAARAADLTFVNAYLNFDPFSDDPVATPPPIFCACGFEEFAGTNDPNVCVVGPPPG